MEESRDGTRTDRTIIGRLSDEMCEEKGPCEPGAVEIGSIYKYIAGELSMRSHGAGEDCIFTGRITGGDGIDVYSYIMAFVFEQNIISV